MPEALTPVRGADTAAEQKHARRQRQRFVRRQWRRRWLTWKYVLAIVVVLTLIGGGIWAVFFSDKLAVAHVEVSGTSVLSAEEVRRVADIESGQPLALVDLDSARTRVSSLAPVASVDVTREWPDGIRLAVTEREVVAVVRFGELLRGMDAEGVVFRSFKRLPRNLPLVEAAADTDVEALSEGASVIAALPPAIASQVEHLSVATVDEITLVLRDGRQVLWGSAEDSATKAEVLVALLNQPGRVYDVSAPNLPTVRS